MFEDVGMESGGMKEGIEEIVFCGIKGGDYIEKELKRSKINALKAMKLESI